MTNHYHHRDSRSSAAFRMRHGGSTIKHPSYFQEPSPAPAAPPPPPPEWFSTHQKDYSREMERLVEYRNHRHHWDREDQYWRRGWQWVYQDRYNSDFYERRIDDGDFLSIFHFTPTHQSKKGQHSFPFEKKRAPKRSPMYSYR